MKTVRRIYWIRKSWKIKIKLLPKLNLKKKLKSYTILKLFWLEWDIRTITKRLLDLSSEESELRKKIKLENELITNKLKDADENFDIDQHKIEKFLLILHLPMQSINSEENTDDTDGIPDTILKIALKLTELLKNNIHSLKIPEILKLALKKLRSLFLIKKDGKTKLRARVDCNPRKQVAQHQIARQQRRPVRAPEMSVKNMKGRVRERRFKIKRMMTQPKNAEVKKKTVD